MGSVREECSVHIGVVWGLCGVTGGCGGAGVLSGPSCAAPQRAVRPEPGLPAAPGAAWSRKPHESLICPSRACDSRGEAACQGEGGARLTPTAQRCWEAGKHFLPALGLRKYLHLSVGVQSWALAVIPSVFLCPIHAAKHLLS